MLCIISISNGECASCFLILCDILCIMHSYVYMVS